MHTGHFPCGDLSNLLAGGLLLLNSLVLHMEELQLLLLELSHSSLLQR